MKHAIIFTSQTGNTRQLAEALREVLSPSEEVYFGEPCAPVPAVDRLYIGFWTDKGDCDAALADFLKGVTVREVFLFGTAGFGGDSTYFEKILHRVKGHLRTDTVVVGTYMCQGKMPLSVRERYERMLAQPIHIPNLNSMIANFDRAFSHPDATDIAQLKAAVRAVNK